MQEYCGIFHSFPSKKALLWLQILRLSRIPWTYRSFCTKVFARLNAQRLLSGVFYKFNGQLQVLSIYVHKPLEVVVWKECGKNALQSRWFDSMLRDVNVTEPSKNFYGPVKNRACFRYSHCRDKTTCNTWRCVCTVIILSSVVSFWVACTFSKKLLVIRSPVPENFCLHSKTKSESPK